MRFVRIHKTLRIFISDFGRDSQGFDFHRGFVRIHETLGEDFMKTLVIMRLWDEDFMRLWERICEGSTIIHEIWERI